MSLFGKILAVLNLLALCAFLYLAVVDFQVRQAWAYAVFRWDLALDGFPVDTEEPGAHNRLRHLNLNEPLCVELVGDKDIRTLEDFLGVRKADILNRVDDEKRVKGKRVEKLCDVLIQLAPTAGEREQLQKIKLDQPKGAEDKLRIQLDAELEALRKLPPNAGPKDRDAKKLAIARALIALVDVLPTEEEKQQRAADPTTDKTYKQTLSALGLRTMTRALDIEAREILAMADAAGNQRQQDRGDFVYRHQQLVNQLIDRENKLQDLREQLETNRKLTLKQEERAIAQGNLVTEKQGELEKLRLETARGKRDAKGKLERAGLEQLEQEQLKVFRLRMMLRDANRLNQEAEQQIRELEAKKTQKGDE